MTDLPHTLPATIRALTETEAILDLHSGQMLRVPKNSISETAMVGSTIFLAFFSSTDMAEEHERLAKAVLTELLRGR